MTLAVERVVILSYDEHVMSFKDIGSLIGRDSTTIACYQRNPNLSIMCTCCSANQKFSESDVRHIVQVSDRSKKSAWEILQKLKLALTVWRVQQVLSFTSFLRYGKIRKAPYLQCIHNDARLSCSRRYTQWKYFGWTFVIFTDEKKIWMHRVVWNANGIIYGPKWSDLVPESKVVVR